jgi:hypothetical protein
MQYRANAKGGLPKHRNKETYTKIYTKKAKNKKKTKRHGWVRYDAMLDARLKERVLRSPSLELHRVAPDNEGIANGVSAMTEYLEKLEDRVIAAMARTHGGDEDQRKKLLSIKALSCEKNLDIFIAEMFRLLAKQDKNNIEILEPDEVLLDGGDNGDDSGDDSGGDDSQ